MQQWLHVTVALCCCRGALWGCANGYHSSWSTTWADICWFPKEPWKYIAFFGVFPFWVLPQLVISLPVNLCFCLSDAFPCHHNHQCWSNWFHFEVIFCCFHGLPSNLILHCTLCMEGKPVLFQESSNKMIKQFNISVCLRQTDFFVSIALDLSLYL